MTTVTDTPAAAVEDVESFRLRARKWIRENLGSLKVISNNATEEEKEAELDHQRSLQKMLFDAGFAGIAVPKEYGGQGLTAAHVQAFNDEITSFDYPSHLQIPNMTPCMAVILEFGTHEQKLRHVPPILKGEHVFMQFLSEPSSGSDAAGAQTTAVRDGDEWILNGSKMWGSATRADWGLCLARTNWDVEKHRGLTVFLVPVKSPGLVVGEVEMVGGGQLGLNYFTDVRVLDAERIGEVDGGWTVGIRWLFYERSFALSPYIIRPGGGSGFAAPRRDALLQLARKSGRISDPLARQLIGEVDANALVGAEASSRIAQGIRTGHLSDQGAALSRLLSGVNGTRQATVAFELAGTSGFAWADDDSELGRAGMSFLTRQAGQIGGGTTEMARNVISERVLGMPREWSGDRDIAYREVPKGPPSKS